ncbi:hypothetical protein FACS1894182_02100 [Bacteroidia bacterium]|nr:hypothetical protein FACS1894182_02100 [Bacteroidia bacterium]
MKNKIKVSLLIGMMAVMAGFQSCKDENDGLDVKPKINKVYLENAQSTKTDREVSFARQGQLLRLEGEGFTGVTKVDINGYSCYFNPVFVTNTSMLVRVNMDTPVFDAPDDVRNTIRLEKTTSNYLIYDFEIRAAAPSITSVSHTMPAAGDVILITGKGLQEIAKIEFPGGILATDYSGNAEGTEVTVTVPAGLSDEGGSILIVGANGGAYSPACFNYKKGLLHNFDDVQNYSWGSGIDNTALTDVIPAGIKPASQGGYQVFNANGNLAANNDQRFWLNSTAIMTIMGNIPASTPAADCGIQMDIYVEGEWNSGIIRFAAADGWGASRYCMIYQPVYENNKVVPFVNPGCWFTVTLPFSLSADFEGKTLGDIITQMSAATYKQSGPWFENSGISGVFDAVPATEKVYFDNIRFVPLTTPVYSDFPDEE